MGLYKTNINLFITSYCTLRCKYCSWSFPYFPKNYHSDKDIIIKSIEKTFQIFDYTSDFRLAGAEAFLHPEIEEIIEAAEHYKDKFNFLSIVTNGTYIPRASILHTISNLSCNYIFRIDDYGIHSNKLDELINVVKSYGIEPEVRPYNEHELAFGGWIVHGDYSHKNYSDLQLQEMYKTCKMPEDCIVIWDGKVILCPYIASGIKLGKLPESKRDSVDLFDESLSVEDKISLIGSWKNTPLLGCQYCNGYDPENSPRIPAAEQLP